MKATVDGKDLAEAAALTESVSDAKSTNEMLGLVRMEFEMANMQYGNVIRMAATDSELRVSVTVPAEVPAFGVVLVPAKRLQEVTARLAGGPVTLEVRGGAMVMRGAGSRVSLPWMDPKEFPAFPKVLDAKEYRVNAEVFLTALRACATFVAGPQDSRHVLKGVHVLFGDGIQMEATDGHRLTTLRVPVPDGAGEVPAADVLIPPNLFGPAGLMLRSGKPITVVVADREVGFCTADVQLFGRLIEGKYVAFQNHLTAILKNPLTATVNVEQLIAAVQIVQIVTQHIPANPVKLCFGHPDQPDVLLVTDEAGDTDNKIPGVKWEGKPFSILLKSDYLLDFLRLMPGTADVRFLFANPEAPAGLLAHDGNPTGAILPLRPTATRAPVPPAQEATEAP